MKNVRSWLCVCLLAVLACCASSCTDDQEIKEEFFFTTPLTDNVFDAPFEGRSEFFVVRTNIQDWSAVPALKEGYDWCSAVAGVSGKGDQIITFDVEMNPSSSVREAEFLIQPSVIPGLKLKVIQMGADNTIMVDTTAYTLSNAAQEFKLPVMANVEYKLENSKPWLELLPATPTKGELIRKIHTYRIQENLLPEAREEIIRIIPADGTDRLGPVEVRITQEAAEKQEVPEDKKLKITGVELLQGGFYTPKYTEANTIDGDYSTYYGSGKKVQQELPVIFKFNLEPGVEKVDYVILYQRKDHEETRLTKGVVEYNTAEDPAWKKCADINVAGYPGQVTVKLRGADHPASLRVTLERSTYPGSLALAEFECYESSGAPLADPQADAAFFGDPMLTSLKPDFVMEDIAKITHPSLKVLAHRLLEGGYSTEFRCRTYKSIKTPYYVTKELTIGKRSVCDNPTGIFFEKGKEYVVVVSEELGSNPLNLGIYDWRDFDDAHQRGSDIIPLVKGINVFTAPRDGTGYIQYWTQDDNAFPDIKVHFCLGNEIGFWDVRAGHTNKDWPHILQVARKCADDLKIQHAMLDISGERVQMVNTVEAYEKYCPDVEAAIGRFDEMMRIEYSVMGLYKYNAVPKNRILGVRTWGGNPNWNGTCANFPNREEEMFSEKGFLSKIWLYGHEFGHGNQVAQMKGAGWTEVTNNIYGQHAMYYMNHGQCRLEQSPYARQGYKEDGKIVGELFNAYINDGVVKGKNYLNHESSKDNVDEHGNQIAGANVFVTMVPLWQLSLFFMIAEDTPWYRPDFWPDVNWNAMHNDTGQNPDNKNDFSAHYVNFMKRVINASGYNMCGFFRNMGLLREMKMSVGDYGPPKDVVITKADVAEIEALGATRPDAPSPVINYISVFSLDAFQHQRAVEGVFNKGVTDHPSIRNAKTVTHSVWKNVVAFETYAGEKLVEACIVGTGSDDNSTTLVRYPEGSTRIEAVSWDGKRTLVYGTR